MSNLSDSAVLEPPASTEAPNAESFTPQGEYSQRELALLARLSLKVTPAVSARSRCDETMDAIKSYILREHLQSGDVMPTETQLCDTIGASRSSVREAVRKLEALNIALCPWIRWWKRSHSDPWCLSARISQTCRMS